MSREPCCRPGLSLGRSRRHGRVRRQVVFPKPEDTAYYVGVARNIVEGRGLVSDALWSYGTPPLNSRAPRSRCGSRCRHSWRSSRWLVFGTTFAAAQSLQRPRRGGRLGPAWRLAIDVASERAYDLRRSRRVGLGAGLTSAVYLPMVLNSALPDSTIMFAAIVLGACLLMTRIVRTHAAPGSRTRASSPWVYCSAWVPDKKRNDLVGVDLGGARLAIRRRPGIRAPPARRHRRCRRTPDLCPVGLSQPGRVPAARCRARPSPMPCT